MRVLVIDDDPQHEMLLEHLLRQIYGIGITVMLAPTFALAKRRLADSRPWSLIVADFHLDDGHTAGELFDGLKLPVLLVTADDPRPVIEAATSLGYRWCDKTDTAGLQQAMIDIAPITAPSKMSRTAMAWRLLPGAVKVLLPIITFTVTAASALLAIGISRGQDNTHEQVQDAALSDLKTSQQSIVSTLSSDQRDNSKFRQEIIKDFGELKGDMRVVRTILETRFGPPPSSDRSQLAPPLVERGPDHTPEALPAPERDGNDAFP